MSGRLDLVILDQSTPIRFAAGIGGLLVITHHGFLGKSGEPGLQEDGVWLGQNRPVYAMDGGGKSRAGGIPKQPALVQKVQATRFFAGSGSAKAKGHQFVAHLAQGHGRIADPARPMG